MPNVLHTPCAELVPRLRATPAGAALSHEVCVALIESARKFDTAHGQQPRGHHTARVLVTPRPRCSVPSSLAAPTTDSLPPPPPPPPLPLPPALHPDEHPCVEAAFSISSSQSPPPPPPPFPPLLHCDEECGICAPAPKTHDKLAGKIVWRRKVHSDDARAGSSDPQGVNGEDGSTASNSEHTESTIPEVMAAIADLCMLSVVMAPPSLSGIPVATESPNNRRDAEFEEAIWKCYGTQEISPPTSWDQSTRASSDYPWGVDSPDEPLYPGMYGLTLPLITGGNGKLLNKRSAAYRKRMHVWATGRSSGYVRQYPHRNNHFAPPPEERELYRQLRSERKGWTLDWEGNGGGQYRQLQRDDVELPSPASGGIPSYMKRRRRRKPRPVTSIRHFPSIEDIMTRRPRVHRSAHRKSLRPSLPVRPHRPPRRCRTSYVESTAPLAKVPRHVAPPESIDLSDYEPDIELA